MDDKSYKLLWRGTLGGLMGVPVFVVGSVLNDMFRLGYVRAGGAYHFMALFYLLPIGAALGAITGGIIWVFTRRGKADLSPIKRAGVGVCFILLLSGLVRLITYDVNSGLIPPTPIETLINGLFFVTSFGVLPGLMAHSKSNRVAEE